MMCSLMCCEKVCLSRYFLYCFSSRLLYCWIGAADDDNLCTKPDLLDVNAPTRMDGWMDGYEGELLHLVIVRGFGGK